MCGCINISSSLSVIASTEPGLHVSTPAESGHFVGETVTTPYPVSEEVTEQPTVEDSSFGWGDNESALFPFTTGGFDQSTGSGLQPPVSEEDTLSTLSPVSETDIPQPFPDDKEENVKLLPENKDTTAERK